MIEGVRAGLFDGERLLVVDDLEVPEPGPGDVVVRVLASGICHSDVSAMDGTSPVPGPFVPGHQAAGRVEALGDSVTGLAVGDEVVVMGLRSCGSCRACRRGRPTACPKAFGGGATPFRWRGQPVRSYANSSSFSSVLTVPHGEVWPVPGGLSLAAASLIPCAVLTGWGVVTNVAKVQPGDVVAVFGVGGVGVNAIRAAQLASASSVIAVDINPGKEDAARRFGADVFVTDAGAIDVAVDVAVECSGALAAIEAAVGLPAPGGTTALVGLPGVGVTATFDVTKVIYEREIAGSLGGAIQPERDLPRVLEVSARFDLEDQVSGVWPLEDVDTALAALARGEVVRAVLDLS